MMSSGSSGKSISRQETGWLQWRIMLARKRVVVPTTDERVQLSASSLLSPLIFAGNERFESSENTLTSRLGWS
jgi:hypothetical protein